MSLNPSTNDLTPEELRGLFFTVARALTFDALRLGKRERMLVLLLAVESFGEGSASGILHIEAWRQRFGTKSKGWRTNELTDMLADFQRFSWITVDATEGTYRLAPDQLPGWQAAMARQLREGSIPLMTPEDVKKLFAKISQEVAARGGGSANGQSVAKISHGEPDCENFAVAGPPPIAPSARGKPPNIPIKPPNTAVPNRTDSAEKPTVDRPASRVNRLTDSSVVRSEGKSFPGITDEAEYQRSRQINGQVTEAELMRQLHDLLGPEEMNAAGGHWRVDHVRQHPALMERLLIQLRELVNVGWQFKTNRAAWLEGSIKNELARAREAKA